MNAFEEVFTSVSDFIPAKRSLQDPEDSSRRIERHNSVPVSSRPTKGSDYTWTSNNSKPFAQIKISKSELGVLTMYIFPWPVSSQSERPRLGAFALWVDFYEILVSAKMSEGHSNQTL